MKHFDGAIHKKNFELYTDSERMRLVFQQQLPGFTNDKLLVTHCRIEHSRHKIPVKEGAHKKIPLFVCYRLDVVDQYSRKTGMQMLYAKVYREGGSRKDFDELSSALHSPPSFGDALIHLPQHDMIIWAFPNDPALPHLPEVTDSTKVKDHLPYDLLPTGLDESGDIVDISVKVIRYRPESHCVIRYIIQWKKSDALETYTLYGKAFKNHSGRDVSEWMARLWQKSLQDRNCLRVARPMGYNAAIRTSWQVGLNGVGLMACLDLKNYKTFMESVVKGLIILHESNLSSPVTIEINDRLREIQKNIARLISAFPEKSESLLSISGDLEEDAPRLPQSTHRVIHGDFHIEQLLVHETQVTLFDFDDITMGDPMQDLATFIVDLHFRPLDPALVALIIPVFFDFYQLHATWEVSVDRLNWHIRLQCIQKAFRCFKNHKIHEKVQTEQLVQGFIATAKKGISLGTLE